MENNDFTLTLQIPLGQRAAFLQLVNDFIAGRIRARASVPDGAVESPGADRTEEAGVEALKRLYTVACGRSGQCRYVARFLLSLYNGQRFPLDPTELRAIDEALFEDCMAVLRMDARLTRREVHNYVEDGGRKWERLASDWNVVDVAAVMESAKHLAEQVDFSSQNAQAAAELLDLIEGNSKRQTEL